jgi:acyl-CoA synthetase (NDP forming)
MSDPLPKGNSASLTSAADAHSRAILLYVEGTTHGRKFMSAARAASLIKPVLVLQAGRSNAGARAATYTGVLAGADAVYDAAFRRAGMLRVGTMAELFDAAETLALTHEQVGERLAILTNGGGAGVLATGRARHTEQGAASSRARSRASRVCFSTATVICQSVRGLEGAEVSSHLTPRWSEKDSNPRSPLAERSM